LLTEEQVAHVRAQIWNAVLTGEQIKARTGNIRVDTYLKQLEVPHMENAAAAEVDWFKRKITPYLRDLGSVVGSAAGAAGAYALGARSGTGVRAGGGRGLRR
jgi:hypothetical protein